MPTTKINHRFLRIARIGFAWLSAAISLAAVFMWVRGAWRIDLAGYGDKSQEHGLAVIAGQGRIVVGVNVRSNWIGVEAASWQRDRPEAVVELAEWMLITGDNEPAACYQFGGFLLGWGPGDYPFVVSGVPAWFVAVVAALPAVLWLKARRKRARRLLSGKCISCGYDLRGSAEICSECGHSIRPITTESL